MFFSEKHRPVYIEFVVPNSPHVRGRLTEQGDFVKLKAFKEAFATHRKYTKVR